MGTTLSLTVASDSRPSNRPVLRKAPSKQMIIYRSRADVKWDVTWVEALQYITSAIQAVYLINSLWSSPGKD